MDNDIQRYIDGLIAAFAATNEKLFAALNATNAALNATITEQERLKELVMELDKQEWRNDERITNLEVAQLRGEAPFLPPAEKMN